MLTDKEKKRIYSINKKNHYGLSNKQLKYLIDKHRRARREGDTKTMEKIEYRLTDINFHSTCSAISKGDYEIAYKEAKE